MLIGPNAARPVSQGGGSATVPGAPVSVPADAIAHALAGYQVPVTVHEGCPNWEVVPEPTLGSLTDPETGQPGGLLQVHATSGTLLSSEHREAAGFTWWEPPGGDRAATITLRTRYRPDASGRHVFGAGGTGWLTLAVDGQEIVTGRSAPAADDPVRAMTRPGEVRAIYEVSAGIAIDVAVTLRAADWDLPPVALRLGIVPEPDEEALLAEAEAAAATAAAAIVIVGTPPGGEAEGTDRTTLALPGRQDELIRRVAVACDLVIVVVNAGMPVLAPWADQVAVVGYAWLPGQAFGEALADVLLGQTEPGGRLPVTIPRAEADCPVLHATQDQDGALRYDEGLLIGYRGYDRAGTEPHFPFGHGLGYTTWSYEWAGAIPSPDGSVTVRVTVRNTGSRSGREVVQAYHEPPGDDPAEPPRTLAAFAAVTAAPGESVTARLTVPVRAFARWSDRDGGWVRPEGEHVIRVGRSSAATSRSAWSSRPPDPLWIPAPPQAPMQPTLYDVAREAGVSTATVSRVLHGQDRVRPATRQRVLGVIEALGYVPDAAAQSMARQRKEVIGLLATGNRSPGTDVEKEGLLFIDEVWRGVEGSLSQIEWSLLISTLHSHDPERAFQRMLRVSAKVDGLLIIEGVVGSERLVQLAARTPVVR